MLKVTIWEREKVQREGLRSLLERVIVYDDYNIRICCCTDNIQSVPEWEEPALYLLENAVDMDESSLLKKIRSHGPVHYIVLMLHCAQEILEGLQPFVRPSGFLLRPVQEAPLRRLLLEVYKDYQRTRDTGGGYCAFRGEDGEHCLPYRTIICFESNLKKVIVRTEAQEFSFNASLAEMVEQAPGYFCRVYKSFCVNTRLIERVDYPAMTIFMQDGTEIPLSRTYKDKLRACLAQV